MIYYFIYMHEDGHFHKKKFNDVVQAAKWRKSWCSNYAQLKFDFVRRRLESSLDVKVDTKEKAEELFDNLVAEAMSMSTVKSEAEFKAVLAKQRSDFLSLNEAD